MYYTIIKTITEEQNIDLIYQVREFEYLEYAEVEIKRIKNKWYLILEIEKNILTKFTILKWDLKEDWWSYISKLNKRFNKSIDTEKFNEDFHEKFDHQI